MQDKEKLLFYINQGIVLLLKQGCFDNGQGFRRTQKQALEAYKSYLDQTSLGAEEKLKGYFEIPTGVGKTALFTAIVAAAYKVAEQDGQSLRSAIVVPTKSLLRQTKKDFENFAPQFQHNVGLFGAGRKNLNLPITIMTYEAWYDLSRRGKISSDNIDILISDEAHKGTSERRIENITGIFDSRTAQIAFTATAHFDEVKSVNKSHEREIFSKSIRVAMVEGADELASYVQGQTIVIRVEPTDFMLSDEFREAATADQTQYRKRIKQNAWNEYVLTAFRDGIDQHTGDLLTDNQSAFFVDGIEQANNLQKMLNEDPELKRRAEKQGYTEVAMAIHSKLSDIEQEKHFEAYKKGQYLAIIGDEMFKEGFDHAPLKTIVDYSHASMVDKAQILGRGTRYWWNEAKMRSEGLTVIDTVVYIGSKVPELDQRLRKAALRGVVSVKQILEDSRILGPGAPEKKTDPSEGARDIFGDDPNVEYFADIEDVYRLENEISEIRRDHWVDVTDEIVEKFQSEFERTGLGGRAVFSKIEVPPEGLDGAKAANIISGHNKTTKPEYIQALLDAYADQTDGFKKLISDIDRQKIIGDYERTGLGGKALHTKMGELADGLGGEYLLSVVSGIVDGTRKYLDPNLLKLLIDTYTNQPDGRLKLVSIEDKEKMKSEYKRTGIAGTALYNRMSSPPKDLDAAQTANIVSGRAIKADPLHVQSILLTFSEQPNTKKKEVSDSDLEKIQGERLRTGVLGTALFGYMENPPKGLTPVISENIVSGTRSKADPSYVKAILEAYKKLPDDKLKIISNDDLEKMNSEADRTGLAGTALFGKIQNPPENLDARLTRAIVRGGVKRAHPLHVEAILEAYKAQPDYTPENIVSEADLEKMNSEAKRTGLGGVAIFNKMASPPEGLDAPMTHHIIAGVYKRTKQEYIDAILNTYKGINLRPIAVEDFSKIGEEKKRTGLGGKAIFNKMASPPEGLTSNTAKNIVNGGVKITNPEYISALLSTYSALPDKGRPEPKAF